MDRARPLVWRTADNSAVDDRSGSSREPANLIAELRQPARDIAEQLMELGNDLLAAMISPSKIPSSISAICSLTALVAAGRSTVRSRRPSWNAAPETQCGRSTPITQPRAR
jgi:hypothetical protein